MNNMIEDQILVEYEKLFIGKELQLYEPEFSSVREISLTNFLLGYCLLLSLVIAVRSFLTIYFCKTLSSG